MHCVTNKTMNRKRSHTSKPKMTVLMAPPIKPSHVFLGDSLMSGVFPKKKPNT